jgi:hypothetical protein
VDLFNAGRYAEALAILDSLAQQYPGNHDIEQARLECLSDLKRSRFTDASCLLGAPEAKRLSVEMIENVLLEKMLRGASESVQVEAARAACEFLRLFGSERAGVSPETQRGPASDAASDGADVESEGTPTPFLQ